MMKKKQTNVHLEDDVADRLDAIGEHYNKMTKNTLLAIVAAEISRVEPPDFFNAIARIRSLQPELTKTRSAKSRTEAPAIV
jgi:predicted DNA-binding protein